MDDGRLRGIIHELAEEGVPEPTVRREQLLARVVSRGEKPDMRGGPIMSGREPGKLLMAVAGSALSLVLVVAAAILLIHRPGTGANTASSTTPMSTAVVALKPTRQLGSAGSTTTPPSMVATAAPTMMAPAATSTGEAVGWTYYVPGAGTASTTLPATPSLPPTARAMTTATITESQAVATAREQGAKLGDKNATVVSTKLVTDDPTTPDIPVWEVLLRGMFIPPSAGGVPTQPSDLMVSVDGRNGKVLNTLWDSPMPETSDPVQAFARQGIKLAPASRSNWSGSISQAKAMQIAHQQLKHSGVLAAEDATPWIATSDDGKLKDRPVWVVAVRQLIVKASGAPPDVPPNPMPVKIIRTAYALLDANTGAILAFAPEEKPRPLLP